MALLLHSIRDVHSGLVHIFGCLLFPAAVLTRVGLLAAVAGGSTRCRGNPDTSGCHSARRPGRRGVSRRATHGVGARLSGCVHRILIGNGWVISLSACEHLQIHANLVSVTLAGAVELRNALNDKFSIELSPTVTLDYPSIAALASHIAAQMPQAASSDDEEMDEPQASISAANVAIASRQSCHKLSDTRSVTCIWHV